MSLVRRSNVFDPFADFWDPFDVFRSVVPAASTDRDTAAKGQDSGPKQVQEEEAPAA